MQKNWYIIYTKPKCEKRVALILSKKKIENFLPSSYRQVSFLRKTKLLYGPLFNSYVFINISENEMAKIKLIDGIINFVFWRGKPAIVPNSEIEAIREFVADYQDIRLEKSAVNLNDIVRMVDRPKYLVEGNLITVKNTKVKLNLPSIGFNMVAEIIPENSLNGKGAFQTTELQLQS
jgi:transcription antitermination factor NusG